MKETAQQYIQRILENLGSQEPLTVLAETPNTLAILLKEQPAAKLRERPSPDRWSAGEILAHLAETEIVIGWRVRSILASLGTPIQAFDQDAWASAGKYAQRDPQKSLEQFRSIRETNLDWYRSLTPEQWQHYGMHAERGKETIEHITRLMAGHDINHLRQIERILA